MNSATGQSSSDFDSQESRDHVPPSAPIALKRGRPPKLRAAVPLTAPALRESCLNFAIAPDVHPQGGPTTTVQPTVPPGMPPSMMPTVINRQVSDAVEQAIALPAPVSSDARRVSTRTTKGQPPIRFGHSGYVAFLIAIFLFLCLSGASASPIPLWNMAQEQAPI